MPAVFNGTNGPAREAAMALIVEMHRWVGIAPLQVRLISLVYCCRTELLMLSCTIPYCAVNAGLSPHRTEE